VSFFKISADAWKVIGWLVTTVIALVGAYPVIAGWLAEFKPTIAVGAVSLAHAPTLQPDTTLAVYVPIQISNDTDDPGCVSDIALLFRNRAGGSEERWFFPVFLVDTPTLADLARHNSPTIGAVKGAFRPIYLEPHSSIREELAFLHRPLTDNSNDILKSGQLKAGMYGIDIFASYGDLSCATTGYERLLRGLAITLPTNSIEAIRSGSVLTPLEAGIDDKRRALMMREK